MATPRDNPYGSFNFQVSADRFGGDAQAVRAGFQEISGLGMEVTVAEYRNGNFKENHVLKMNGLTKTTDVVLKRGMIGVTDFYDWIKAVSDGNPDARATVRIDLMNEENTDSVMSWTLSGAKPMKYTGATLNAKTGTDVAIEELTLSVERLEVA